MNLTSMRIFASTLAVVPVSAISAVFALAAVGVLYALHHLRTQPQRRVTATILFWQQAMRSPQTKVPWSRRFTHRRTFLLLASILLLWAAALAANRWNSAVASRDIIVIDTGEETASPTLTGRTLLNDLAAAAITDLHHLTGGPGLMVAGPQPLLLVQPDQPAAVTAHVLTSLSPAHGASASSLALQSAGILLGDNPGRIVWYTPRGTLPTDLPDQVRQRIVLRQVTAPPAVVICGVEFTAASDGNPHGTLRVQLAGAFAQGMALRAKVAEIQPVERPVAMTQPRDGVADGNVAFDDWPADGRVVSLSLLNAPGPPATQTIDYRVPDRRPPVFRFASDVPAALQLALLSFGVDSTKTSNRKIIFVALKGTPIPPDAVASITVDRGQSTTGSAASPRRHPAVARIGVGRCGHSSWPFGPGLAGTPILSAGSTTLMSLDFSGPLPNLTLSSTIVDPIADLPRHAAFPVLLERLCAAMTGRVASPVVISQLRSACDPLWAGPLDAPPLEIFTAANRPQVVEPPAIPSLGSSHGTWPWADTFHALAAMLLILESLLYIARRIV